MAPSGGIGDVLRDLDEVVARAREERSRVGYFAVVYRKTTAKVAEGLDSGFFDDPARMERFDITFARRYLQAVDDRRHGRAEMKSWQAGFDAAGQVRPIILQHVLAGMNAHINLDLGIAAAETAPGADLPGLRRDFDRVNEILGLLVSDMARDLGAASPWIWLLDRIGGRHDDEIVRFSIEVARTQAWRFAVELAPLAPEHWAGPIAAMDARTARVARAILNPGLLSLGLAVIRARESNDVRSVIDILNRVEAPDLATVERRVRSTRPSS
ncbi:MAG TPA: DUF5995 family protein [Acidimicrobiales bacterium]|nr:DUF5995 family protein [Acidimicrobiales bacterium]